MPRKKRRARGAALLGWLVLVVFVSAKRAEAQDAPPGTEPAPKSAASAPAPAPVASPPLASDDSSSMSIGPIERMPLSAFPNSPIRGIEGGSLWMTFHGLQWPNYQKTGIGVSGYGWIDTGYEHIARGDPNESIGSEKKMLQQGRVLVRVTPTFTLNSWFVQAQAELVANQDQSQPQPIAAVVDDAWVKFGKWNTWDVQVGRYEAWEIYHFGMGLDLYTLERQGAIDQNYTAPPIYGVTYAFYRPQSLGEGAFHWYPAKFLRFELGLRFGNETSYNTYAGRPVAVLDFGWMKLKAGAEYVDSTPLKDGAQEEKKQWGYGGSLQFVVDPVIEFGFNGALGNVSHVKNDGTNDDKGDTKTYSLGAFVNARVVEDLLVGAGINYTYVTDQQYDTTLGRNEDFDHWQAFGAVQYRLWKQLFIKGVGGYALANFNPNEGALVYKNEMVSGRLRLLFLF